MMNETAIQRGLESCGAVQKRFGESRACLAEKGRARRDAPSVGGQGLRELLYNIDRIRARVVLLATGRESETAVGKGCPCQSQFHRLKTVDPLPEDSGSTV
jgi:hypothetical protein